MWDFPFLIPFRFYRSLYICSTKCMDSLTLKRHSSFENWNNTKATHIFSHTPLIFKLQQQVLKLDDICVIWSALKTDLKTNFLNLEKKSFENATFFNKLIHSFAIIRKKKKFVQNIFYSKHSVVFRKTLV